MGKIAVESERKKIRKYNCTYDGENDCLPIPFHARVPFPVRVLSYIHRML